MKLPGIEGTGYDLHLAVVVEVDEVGLEGLARGGVHYHRPEHEDNYDIIRNALCHRQLNMAMMAMFRIARTKF
jgi:hypothetical protein